jgi:hypothetical protein
VSAYDLPSFCSDLRAILKAEGTDGLPAVARKLEELLANPAFVAATFSASDPPGKRELYHDPETDAYVLAHVHVASKVAGAPHSHGTSWAVYGNARGVTDMTVWRRVNPATEEHAELVAADRYRLGEGEARPYASGTIHSTFQPASAWVVRVTGTDLDALERFRFKGGRDRILETPVGA